MKFANIFDGPAPISKRHQCPCCGGLTLNESAAYNICWLCHWIDDGRDEGSEDEVWNSLNSDYSLSEARRNFKKFRMMFRPGDQRYRQSGRELKIKGLWMSAFENWTQSDVEGRSRIERKIIIYESALETGTG